MSFSHYTIAVNSGNKRPIIYQSMLRRLYLLIENRSVAEIYVNFGRAADNINGIRIFAGGTLEYEQAVPQGEVHVAGSISTDQSINITEG